MEEGLRLVIERHGAPVGFKLRSASYKGEGIQPGVHLERWDQLRDLIYEGRGECDTNLLVYAHREDAEWFGPASECLRQLAEGMESWAVPWPCLHEFLAIVTHPLIFLPPTPMERAFDQVAAWMESPSLVVLGEARGYWDVFQDVALGARIVGSLLHDARVAALCLHHGVDELWTADRDFGRFPALKVRNPLVV